MFSSKKLSLIEVSRLIPVAAPVIEALILICEKCGKKLSRDPENNPARTIQLGLKDAIRAEGSKETFRAVLTSCMDICPEGQIALAISRTNEPNIFYAISGPLNEATAQSILENVKSSATLSTDSRRAYATSEPDSK